MSDTQETLSNVPQFQPAAELERTLSLIQRELETETQKSQQQENNPIDSLKNREQIIEECLSRARNYYIKKEWPRAFAEWDKVCAFLAEGDEFLKKIAALKASHENLAKVNRELAEIKGILSQRSSPPAADRKFIQDAHEQTNGQIKNVYSYLSQQLRTERTPKTLSFWWPVLLAVILIGAGYGSLSAYYGKMRVESRKQAEKNGQDSRMELAAVQAERDELFKKAASLKQDYEDKIEELKQQNIGWRNAGREKIDEMEYRIKELENKNKELSGRAELLIQDNLSKDGQIADLQTRSA